MSRDYRKTSPHDADCVHEAIAMTHSEPILVLLIYYLYFR